MLIDFNGISLHVVLIWVGLLPLGLCKDIWKDLMTVLTVRVVGRGADVDGVFTSGPWERRLLLLLNFLICLKTRSHQLIILYYNL